MYSTVLLAASLLAVGAATLTCTDAGNGPCLSGSCQSGESCVTYSTQQVCCPSNKVVTQTSHTSRPSCRDKVNPQTGVSDCPRRSYLCNDSTYYAIMTQQCPQTCGRCGSSGYTTRGYGSCADRTNPSTGVSDCPRLTQYCTNTAYRTLMQQECPKTCGFC
ncbi:unnamed protein product, partial [Mesorhabditis spiculigera]